jgi:RNA-directed DNA polymerase
MPTSVFKNSSPPSESNELTIKNIKQLFKSYFHDKHDFRLFHELDVSSETKVVYSDHKKVIYGCSEELKAVHKFLNSFIFRKLKVRNDLVFSYRTGHNVLDALTPHAESKFYFKTDISNFFPSIKSDLVLSTLELNVADLAISDLREHLKRITDLVTLQGALPVGFSTSPLLSNACLYNFDNKISLFCEDSGLIYSRYSDDIIISSGSKINGMDMQKTLDSMLSDGELLRFKINEKKTRLLSKGNKVKLLGAVILPSGKITVDMQVKKRVESMIHFYMNDKEKFIDFSGVSYDVALNNLSGLLNHISSIDSDYLDKLRMKYGNAIIDMFFHKSVK